jgi:hypothetical protein
VGIVDWTEAEMNKALMALALLLPLGVAACGGGSEEKKTVVINPPPNSTVLVPPSGEPKICPSGQTSC